MRLLESKKYRQEITDTAALQYDWHMFKDANILISGASGMIGSFLIDVLMSKKEELNILKRRMMAFGNRLCFFACRIFPIDR